MEFYNKIVKSNARIISRNYLKKMVVDNSDLLIDLVQIALNTADKNHHKAIWIVEMIAEKNTELLTDFTSDLIAASSLYKHQSAVRGMSRIVYFISVSNAFSLTEVQQEIIIKTCLDWLIGDAKVAPKAFAMYTLSHFCKKHDWLKDVLKNIIEKDFAYQSNGYKAAAKVVLKRI